MSGAETGGALSKSVVIANAAGASLSMALAAGAPALLHVETARRTARGVR